jgi:hypothetical protein
MFTQNENELKVIYIHPVGCVNYSTKRALFIIPLWRGLFFWNNPHLGDLSEENLLEIHAQNKSGQNKAGKGI